MKTICIICLFLQVELHTEFERRLPKTLLERVDKVNYRLYPNCKANFIKSVSFDNLKISKAVVCRNHNLVLMLIHDSSPALLTRVT